MSDPTRLTKLPPELTVRRRADGDVVIGPLPAAPAGLVVIPLPGAVAYLDASAADAPTSIVVADEAEAVNTIDNILGEGVGAAVLTANEEESPISHANTECAERITRLGILQWLWTTGTLPLDRSALALERAIAADAVADLLSSDLASDIGSEDLLAAAPLVRALSETLRRTGDAEAWPGLPGLIDEALAALRRRLPLGHPLNPVIEHEADVRAMMRTLGVDRMDWTVWEDLLAEARPRSAEHAGAQQLVAEHGHGSVDWAHVPPGIVDGAEGGVEWWLRPASNDRIHMIIEVPAYRGPTASGGLARLLGGDPAANEAMARLRRDDPKPGLRFKVYSTSFPLPLADDALRLSQDGRRWRGNVELPSRGLDAGRILVDVYGAGLRALPRLGPTAVSAEATRWAARGLSLLRLALADPTRLSGGVREPLDRARQLFATISDTGGPAADLADRQQARCLALTISYLETTGETRTRRLRGNLDELAERIPARDALIPDLLSSRWLPTVSERGLLAHGSELR